MLAVDLGRLERGEADGVRRHPWRGSTPGVDRVGSWSGGALGLALLWEAEVAEVISGHLKIHEGATVAPVPAHV